MGKRKSDLLFNDTKTLPEKKKLYKNMYFIQLVDIL